MEGSASEHATHQDAEPDLDLVQPGRVAWRVHKANAVALILQECFARHFRFQHAAPALFSQVIGQLALPSHISYQAFGPVNVQLVADDDPLRVRVGTHGASHVVHKVHFGPRGLYCRAHDLARHHVQVGDQALRAVAFVLEFAAFDLAGSCGLGRGDAFQRLDAGHFIGADRVSAVFGPSLGSLQIRVTHGLHPHVELRVGLFVRRVEPVPRAMRLQIARLLKNAPHGGPKSKGRFPV